MNETLESLFYQLWGLKDKITKEEFLAQSKAKLGYGKEELKALSYQIIQAKNLGELEYALSIIDLVEEENEMIEVIHQLLLEPWHTKYEDLVHDLQHRARPESIPYLKQAMQNKYEYLESYGTGTRQLINQCGHALWSIRTEEAIAVIRELSQSDDPVVKDEMLYRLSKIEGRNDYQRNYDLE